MENLIDGYIEYISGVKRYSARTQQGYRDVLGDFRDYLLRELDTQTSRRENGQTGQAEQKEQKGQKGQKGQTEKTEQTGEKGETRGTGQIRGEDECLLRGMSAQVLRGYEVYLMKERRLSARSVGLYMSVLSSFAKYLMKKDLLSANPVRTVTRPKVPKRLPEFYRKDSIDSYFEQTRPYGTDTILDILGLAIVTGPQATQATVTGSQATQATVTGPLAPQATVSGPQQTPANGNTGKDGFAQNAWQTDAVGQIDEAGWTDTVGQTTVTDPGNQTAIPADPATRELYAKCLRRLIISILYNTGIRRSELISLDRSNFDPARRVLHVRGKGDKMREIPLTASLCEEILLYLKVLCRCGFDIDRQDSPLLLTPTGRRLYPQFVDKAVKQELGSVPGISGRKSPHVLRHTIATELLDEGTDINSIKELLGHSSLAATQVYTHNSIEKLKKVYNQAHPRSRTAERTKAEYQKPDNGKNKG